MKLKRISITDKKKMLLFRINYFKNAKLDMLNLIVIYHFVAFVSITRVNCERLLESQDPQRAFFAVAAAAADTATTTTAGHNSSYYSNSNHSNGTMCGNTQKMADNCFRDLPPHLMEFLQTSKIAINEEDIVSKCNVFRRGMKCFDDYTSRCIPSHNIHILNNNVEGAKRFFTKFCEDKTFQQDYLTHKECFSYIQEDWMRCTKAFQNILTEGLHSDKNITEKFLEFCCARYAYETCIYNSARYKCYKNSAAFARATAQMLSDEKHFTNCRQFEVSTCSSPPAICQRCHWTLWLGMALLFLTKAHHLMCS